MRCTPVILLLLALGALLVPRPAAALPPTPDDPPGAVAAPVPSTPEAPAASTSTEAPVAAPGTTKDPGAAASVPKPEGPAGATTGAVAAADGPVPGPDQDPGIVEGTLEGAQAIVVGYRTGGWLAALAALVSLLTWLCRRKELGGLLDRLPKRARILVPLVLGAVSALLVGLLDPAVSTAEALTLAFLSGPAAVSLHQGLARSVLGLHSPEAKEREAAASGGGG